MLTDSLTGSLTTLLSDVCYHCGQRGHFDRNCPGRKVCEESRQAYVLPCGGRGLQGVIQHCDSGVSRGGGTSGWSECVAGVGLKLQLVLPMRFPAFLLERTRNAGKGI